MESVGKHGGSSVSHQIRLLDYPHISNPGESRVICNEFGQEEVFRRGGVGIEVEEVVVCRVVERL